jgi:hypothetical protein
MERAFPSMTKLNLSGKVALQVKSALYPYNNTVFIDSVNLITHPEIKRDKSSTWGMDVDL